MLQRLGGHVIKVAERSDTITETGLYEMLGGLISFKAAAATVGLSTDKELLGQLDSPVLGSLKEPLVGRTVVSVTNKSTSGGLPPDQPVCRLGGGRQLDLQAGIRAGKASHPSCPDDFDENMGRLGVKSDRVLLYIKSLCKR